MYLCVNRLVIYTLFIARLALPINASNPIELLHRMSYLAAIEKLKHSVRQVQTYVELTLRGDVFTVPATTTQSVQFDDLVEWLTLADYQHEELSYWLLMIDQEYVRGMYVE